MSIVARVTNYGADGAFPSAAGNLYIGHLRAIDVESEAVARELECMYPRRLGVEWLPVGPAAVVRATAAPIAATPRPKTRRPAPTKKRNKEKRKT